jgi:outer membrane receptor protein involved in Fe transport
LPATAIDAAFPFAVVGRAKMNPPQRAVLADQRGAPAAPTYSADDPGVTPIFQPGCGSETQFTGHFPQQVPNIVDSVTTPLIMTGGSYQLHMTVGSYYRSAGKRASEIAQVQGEEEMQSEKRANLKLLCLSGVALGSMLGAAAPAFAQTVTEEDKIIVTAQKREEALFEVPMGITALDGDALAERGLDSFTEFAALVPGLAIQEGTPSQNRLIIRGLNAGGAGSTVAVYLDDSPIGSSNALANGALNTVNSDTFDMARIEVLRGPQGTLYGANTQGGLIKFVSNAPDLDDFSIRGEVGSEWVSDGANAQSLRAALNIPLDPGVAALRISAYSQDLPGFIDNTSAGIEDANGGFREGIRATFLLRATEDLSFRLTAFHQEVENGANPVIDVVGSASSYAAPPPNRFEPFAGDLEQTRRVEELSTSDFTNLSGTIDWDIGIGDLTSVTSYSETENFNRGDGSNNTATFIPPASPAAPFGVPISFSDYLEAFFYGVPNAGATYFTYNLNKFTQELRLASNSEGPLEWSGGAFYTREESEGFALLAIEEVVGGVSTGVRLDTLASPFGLAGSNNLNSTYEERAIFAQVDYHFTPRFDVAFGGRYAENEQELLYINNPGFLTGPFLEQTQTSSESATTFSIAPRYQLNDDTLLYARVASGYRPGGPNFIPPTAPPGTPTTYTSDNTVNYEVGFRTDLFGGALSVDVAAFHIDWEDIQILVSYPGFTGIGNGGTAESEGVEWAFGLRPFDGLRLNLVGSYVDAILTQDAPAAGALSGDRLAFVPDLTASLDGEYRWNVGAAEFFAGGTYSYVGERFTSPGTNPTIESYVALPSYTTLALRGGMDFGHWRAELFGTNITDERGIISYASAGGGTATITGQLGVIQPRTVGIRLSANY